MANLVANNKAVTIPTEALPNLTERFESFPPSVKNHLKLVKELSSQASQESFEQETQENLSYNAVRCLCDAYIAHMLDNADTTLKDSKDTTGLLIIKLSNFLNELIKLPLIERAFIIANRVITGYSMIDLSRAITSLQKYLDEYQPFDETTINELKEIFAQIETTRLYSEN
jgi:hypothetical protein